MLTYQDLQALGDNEKARVEFILNAINKYKDSELYKTAVVAEDYYKQRNTTINKFQKLLTRLDGSKIPDYWAANHKIASNFFYYAITMQNQHILGNGVFFVNEDTKEKLDPDFDNKLKKAGRYSLTGAVAYAFYNKDHCDIFSAIEYIPLLDEEDGLAKAGIRFWQIDNKKPLMATLYEIDGYTQYIKPKDKAEFEIKTEKQAYIIEMVGDGKDQQDGTVEYIGKNYPTFPIVPLWGNDKKQSELVGIRNTIDAFDLMNSGFVNNVDEANYIYWLIENAGGMDDTDLRQFVERMKFVHTATVNSDAGQKASAHKNEAPYNASTAVLEQLEKRLYDDFMCLNLHDLSSRQKTVPEIMVAYKPLDLKCSAYEYQLIEFINGLLKLAGVDDKPTFQRDWITNPTEQMQMLTQAAQWLDNDTVTKQVCGILGIADQYEDIIKKMSDNDIDRFSGGNAIGFMVDDPAGEDIEE